MIRIGRLIATRIPSPNLHALLFTFMAAPSIRPGIYRHSKSGKLYRVHFVARNSETEEDFVVYETLYDNPASRHWIRPLSMFAEMVVIDGLPAPRFAFLREA
jgi:hypothetical protein